MTTEVTLAAAIEDGSLDAAERRDTLKQCCDNIMEAMKRNRAVLFWNSYQTDLVYAYSVPPSPNWREGFADAWNGEPSRVASPNYCEGYAAGLQALTEK